MCDTVLGLSFLFQLSWAKLLDLQGWGLGTLWLAGGRGGRKWQEDGHEIEREIWQEIWQDRWQLNSRKCGRKWQEMWQECGRKGGIKCSRKYSRACDR